MSKHELVKGDYKLALISPEGEVLRSLPLKGYGLDSPFAKADIIEWLKAGVAGDASGADAIEQHRQVVYPRRNDAGETVWACCESRFGPTCGHREGLD